MGVIGALKPGEVTGMGTTGLVGFSGNIEF